MDKFFKELYNIISNNPNILLVNKELITDIIDYLTQYTIADNLALSNFINRYKTLLLSHNEYIESLRQILYIHVNNKQLKQYIKILDMTKFINKLIKTKIFANLFNKYFVLLTSADIIIDNFSENYIWVTSILSYICEKLFIFTATQAAQNKISANEQIIQFINNEELIKFCSHELHKCYNRHINGLFIDIINNAKIKHRQYPLFLRGELTDNEFNKIAQFLYNKYKEELINYLIDNIDALQTDINSHTASELDNINITTGESISINGNLFHELTHSDKYIPIIYINGNVIAGEAIRDIDGGRIHHSSLFKAYCEDMSLHKFDKIKKSPKEWADLIKGISTFSQAMSRLMEQYKCVWAVQSITGTAVAIIVAYNNIAEAADAFKNQLLNCDKVFACNDSWTELTKEAKLKRLMKKV